MSQFNKKDLLRYIGERLFDLYQKKVIRVAPAYELEVLDYGVDFAEAVFDFFIKPYKQLIEQRNALPEGSKDRIFFEKRYPSLEYELQYVLREIESAVKDYMIQQEKAKLQSDMMESLTADKKVLEEVKSAIEKLGKVADYGK